MNEATWDGTKWVVQALYLKDKVMNDVSDDNTDVSKRADALITERAAKWYADMLLASQPGGAPITTVLQTHTAGATVTANPATNWLVVNPAAILPALAITFPATPVNGQQFNVSFGGIILSGQVVTALTMVPAAGQTLLQRSIPTILKAGENLTYKFNFSTTKWYRL